MLRPTLRFAGLCAGLLISANALAVSLSDLSQSDATGGLKDALALKGHKLQSNNSARPVVSATTPRSKSSCPATWAKSRKR